MKFQNVTVGGTFDHFHVGHQALIDQALNIGEAVWLGITSSVYISNQGGKSANYLTPIEPYQKRYASVKKYLIRQNNLNRVKLRPIDDKFGTILNDKKLEAIVVSLETELVATEINLLRAQKNWP